MIEAIGATGMENNCWSFSNRFDPVRSIFKVCRFWFLCPCVFASTCSCKSDKAHSLLARKILAIDTFPGLMQKFVGVDWQQLLDHFSFFNLALSNSCQQVYLSIYSLQLRFEISTCGLSCIANRKSSYRLLLQTHTMNILLKMHFSKIVSTYNLTQRVSSIGRLYLSETP